MSQKDTIKEMLVNGIAPAAISTSLGVSESYISQLANDEDFKAELANSRTAAAQEDIDFDHKLDAVELAFLEIVETKMRFANFQQSLQGLAVVNKAKRRRETGNHAPQVGMGTVVHIMLPTVIMPQYITNAKNEIVEVEGRTMVSASPKSLDAIISERQRNGTSSNPIQLTGVTRVIRAEGVLQELDNKPVRKLTRAVKDSEIADLL